MAKLRSTPHVRRLVTMLGVAGLGLLGGSATRSAVAANAGTHVFGTIAADATWTPAGSPYILDDNTTVGSGVTLTVAPGVTVEGGYRLNVVGVLDAAGTAADPITFSLTNGIHFYHGSDGSRIAWAEVENAAPGSYGVATEYSATGHAPAPALHDDYFHDNYTAVNFDSPANRAASLANSRFEANAIAVEGFATGVTMTGVAMSSRSADILLGPGDPWDIHASNLLPPTGGAACSSSTEACTVFVQGVSANTHPATGNWWGTTDPAAVSREVWDSSDDPSTGTVTTDPTASAPYDLSPPTSAISVPSGGTLSASAGWVGGGSADDGGAGSGVDHVTASL